MSETTQPNLANPRIRELCGTMEVHRRLLNQSITYQERRAQIDNRAMAYEQQTRSVARKGVLTIPVVVHVVHHPADPPQNVGQAQIQGQIEILNRDFRANNPDVLQVPAVWTDRVADCNIEFRLYVLRTRTATRPTGSPASSSTMPFFTTELDDVKSSATGGQDPWPSDDYLNLWVCNELRDSIGRSLLGYAQFPGGPLAYGRGCHTNYQAFGTMGTAQASVQRRTHGDARGRPLPQPHSHLGGQRPVFAPAPTWWRTRPTADRGRTSARRHGRRSAATTARTATCS